MPARRVKSRSKHRASHQELVDYALDLSATQPGLGITIGGEPAHLAIRKAPESAASPQDVPATAESRHEAERARSNPNTNNSAVTSKQKVQMHAAKVRDALSRMTENQWAVGDEICLLQDAFRAAEGRPLVERDVPRLLGDGRHPKKMLSMAETARFFPPELRDYEVGFRVFEAARKANNKNGKRFKAAQITDWMADGHRTADAIREVIEAQSARGTNNPASNSINGASAGGPGQESIDHDRQVERLSDFARNIPAGPQVNALACMIDEHDTQEINDWLARTGSIKRVIEESHNAVTR